MCIYIHTIHVFAAKYTCKILAMNIVKMPDTYPGHVAAKGIASLLRDTHFESFEWNYLSASCRASRHVRTRSD
jgi:hypothetical protein